MYEVKREGALPHLRDALRKKVQQDRSDYHYYFQFPWLSPSYMPGTALGAHLHSLFVFTIADGGRCYYPHFKDDGTEPLGGVLLLIQGHTLRGIYCTKWEFKSTFSNCRVLILLTSTLPLWKRTMKAMKGKQEKNKAVIIKGKEHSMRRVCLYQ